MIAPFKAKITADQENVNPIQAAEKRPSAVLPSSFVVAAYVQVRLTPQDLGRLASGPF
jgi:hypothetical protein